MNSYHKTAKTTDAEAKQYEKKARKQDEVIAAFFLDHRPLGLTPSEVHRRVLPHAPLTSVRRAMTNLTEKGVLVKTDEQRPGPYGRAEHVWRWRERIADDPPLPSQGTLF